jgi:hypothetical protein
MDGTLYFIELGRWYTNVPKEERICYLCQTNVGNEYHYILAWECQSQSVIDIRNKFIPYYYCNHPNMFCNVQVLKKLSMFIRKLSSIIWYSIVISQLKSCHVFACQSYPPLYINIL